MRGFTVGVEVLSRGATMDKNATEGKAALLVGVQNGTAALDATGACLLSSGGMGPAQYAELMTTATGVPYDVAGYLKTGERIWNLERLWNLKAGLTAADDTSRFRTDRPRAQSIASRRCCRNTTAFAAGGLTAFRHRRNSANWR